MRRESEAPGHLGQGHAWGGVDGDTLLQQLLGSHSSGAAGPQQAAPLVGFEAQQPAPWQLLGGLQAQEQVPGATQGQWGQGTVSGGSGGTSGAADGSGGRIDPATMASKLASAREKNRLAQQRFRERQREKQKQAGEHCEVVQQEIDAVEGENGQLQRQNRIYEKVLAVRDAMLSTFTSLHPPGQHGHMPPMSAAAQGLAHAIDQLPSEGELEAAAPAPSTAPSSDRCSTQHQPGAAQQQPEDASSSGGCAAADLPKPPSYNLAAQHRSGTASQLDGSALRQVAVIPNISDEAIRAQVVAMTEPEHLLDYYRQWQAELSVSYLAAEAAGFDEASVAEVEAVQERMTQVWWYVGEMKPPYLCYLAHAALPENSGQMSLWRDIAAEVFPQMDETQRALLRRSWHSYSKRLAKIAVGVSRWVRKLQEYALQPSSGLVTNARRSLELLDITTHMADAVQEEYIASMEFVANQANTTTAVQKAFINHASAPFLPDVVAIDYNILLMDAEERRALSRPTPSLLPAAPGPKVPPT